VAELLLVLGVIFVAELGDKSQIAALSFAARYPLLPVLVGFTLAVMAVQGVAALAGAAVGGLLPPDIRSLVAGLLFLGFAAWTLRGEDEEDEQASSRTSGAILLGVFTAVFLAELGDKTMLATTVLAAEHGALVAWLGATLGTLLASGAAMLLGRWLGGRLPARTLRLGAAALFAVVGLALVWDALL
jgi:putative Ca2+/H+ antiporter (TMEM165/GDT1 family)